MKKYYQILGLEEDATLEELEKKYGDLLAEFDPKTQSDEGLKEFFKSEQDKVNEAYIAISDSLKSMNDKTETVDQISKVNVGDTNDIQLSYQILKLSEDATLAEINNQYNLILDELKPEDQPHELKNFFETEQEKITEAYNKIIQFLAKQNSNETLHLDGLKRNEASDINEESDINEVSEINEESNFIEKSNVIEENDSEINYDIDNIDRVIKQPSYSWWKYDDEYITGSQYWIRSFVGSMLSVILIGIYLNSVTAYKRAKSLGASGTFFSIWGALYIFIAVIPGVQFINLPFHLYLWFSNGPGKN